MKPFSDPGLIQCSRWDPCRSCHGACWRC